MVLDSIKVVVYFCLELKEVLSNSDIYSYSCLGSDVVMGGGIVSSKDKVSLTIDETYEGVTHQLGDKLSLCSFDIIYITNVTAVRVEVCHITIVGHNYYGIIFVPENTAIGSVLLSIKMLRILVLKLDFWMFMFMLWMIV